jgi:hypothetical protein
MSQQRLWQQALGQQLKSLSRQQSVLQQQRGQQYRPPASSSAHLPVNMQQPRGVKRTRVLLLLTWVKAT